MSKKYRPTNEEMNDLCHIIDDTLDKLCEMAAKHNIDRNELVNYYANVITGIAEFANIQNCETNHTNADRIRNMSDEELTEFIVGLNKHCLAGIGQCDRSAYKTCENCNVETKDWLQSEAE